MSNHADLDQARMELHVLDLRLAAMSLPLAAFPAEHRIARARQSINRACGDLTEALAFPVDPVIEHAPVAARPAR